MKPGVFACILLVAALMTAYFAFAAEEWGPYGCVGECTVATPYADGTHTSGTRAALERLDGLTHVGDTIMICNTDFCTTYKVSSNGGFIGGAKVARNPPGPPPPPPPLNSSAGGGGGGGSGGGGGYNPPGGCYGSSCYDFDCKVGGRPCSELPTAAPPVREEQ